jgi:hypothetical protein
MENFMKTQNVLKNLLLCAALTAAPIFSSFAGEGGLSGGGGDLTESDKIISTNDLLDVAEKIAVMSLQSVHYHNSYPGKTYLGMDIEPAPKLKELFKKDLLAIYRDFTKVKFVRKQVGPCLATENRKVVEKDASANPVTKEICISLERLENKKLNLASIVALIAHEYSHIFGADENEARYIQNIIQNLEQYSLKDFDPGYLYPNFWRLNILFDDIQKAKESKNNFQFCAKLDQIKDTIEHWGGTSPFLINGLFTTRMSLRVELLIARICFRASGFYEATFNGKTKANLNKLYRNYFDEYDSESIGVTQEIWVNKSALATYVPIETDFTKPSSLKAVKQEIELIVDDLKNTAAIVKVLLGETISKHMKPGSSIPDGSRLLFAVPETFPMSAAEMTVPLWEENRK